MERPNGSGQISGGWVLLIFSVFLIVFGIFVSAGNTDDLALKSSLLVIGSSGMGISFLLFATGWIIRAISFLPGRDEVATPVQPIAPAEGVTMSGEEISSSNNLILALFGVTALASIALYLAL